jgi:hypothetical protein
MYWVRRFMMSGGLIAPPFELASVGGEAAHAAVARRIPGPNRILKHLSSLRLLKKVQMQGGPRCEARGVLRVYVAAPRERANAADGPFSAAC